MIQAIVIVTATAVLGSLTIPLSMIALARFGLFPPITLQIFGRTRYFAPRSSLLRP